MYDVTTFCFRMNNKLFLTILSICLKAGLNAVNIIAVRRMNWLWMPCECVCVSDLSALHVLFCPDK